MILEMVHCGDYIFWQNLPPSVVHGAFWQWINGATPKNYCAVSSEHPNPVGCSWTNIWKETASSLRMEIGTSYDRIEGSLALPLSVLFNLQTQCLAPRSNVWGEKIRLQNAFAWECVFHLSSTLLYKLTSAVEKEGRLVLWVKYIYNS